MIKHYFKIAFRQLTKYKVHYLFSITSIALGLLCFSLTIYYVKEGMNAFIAWPNANRMASIYVKSPTDSNGKEYIPGKELYALINNPVAGIEHVTWLEKTNEVNITFDSSDGKNILFLCNILKATPDFVSTYSVRTIDGSTPVLKTGEVFIAESMAKKVFASENPIGKVLYFTKTDQDTTIVDYYTISAVIKDLPRMTREQADLYFPQNTPVKMEQDYRKAVTVLLAKGISAQEINKRLQKQIPRFGEHTDCYLTVETFYEQIKKPEYLMAILLFPLMGAFILIVAMINFLKLCINDFYSRTKELSLRKSLGSTSKELFLFLFVKVFILLFLAVFVTFILTELFLPLVYMYHPKGATILKVEHLELIYMQFKFLLALFIISAGVCLWMIYHINRIHIINSIRKKKHFVRNSLLGVQVFTAFLFVGITTVTYIENNKLQKTRNQTLTTKQTSEIWKINLKDMQLRCRENEIIDRLKKEVNIEDVIIDTQGLNVAYETPQGDILNGSRKLVSENYADFMKLPIQGRMPHTEDEVIVSRTLIWNLEKDGLPTDIVVFKDKTYQITGTYDALPFDAIFSKEEFDKNRNCGFSIITLANEQNKQDLYVKSVSGQGKAGKDNILTVIRIWLPETIPFTIFSMEEDQFMNNGLGRMMRDVFMLFTVIILIIITFSLYSAITIDTETRKKEVAIRKINGAGYKVISLLFGRLYIRLLCITVIPALLIVYLYISALTRLVGSNSNGWINNPLLWLSIIFLVVGVVFITIVHRIRYISRLNPADVIKTE